MLVFTMIYGCLFMYSENVGDLSRRHVYYYPFIIFAYFKLYQPLLKSRLGKIPFHMIRVLHVFKTYYPYSYGGIEQVIRAICSYGNRNGIYSEILICGPENKVYSYDGVKVNVVQNVVYYIE